MISEDINTVKKQFEMVSELLKHVVYRKDTKFTALVTYDVVHPHTQVRIEKIVSDSPDLPPMKYSQTVTIPIYYTAPNEFLKYFHHQLAVFELDLVDKEFRVYGQPLFSKEQK